MAYDPTNEALIRAMLTEMDPQEGDDDLAYVDLLRRAQAVLVDRLARSTDEEPPREEQNAVAQALGRLDPHADDALVDHGTRLRRLQARIDLELFRWTSGMVQPPGPSGAVQVAEPQTIAPQG